MNISLVIPSRNNLKYLKSAYESIRLSYGFDVELILMDDASTDGTWNWLKSIECPRNKIYRNEGPERIGHTVLYDVGAKMASNEIFGIFHADMITSPNYLKNMIKHIKKGTVVSGTRIEPPLHPPGPEKIVENFGMEPEEFKQKEFVQFVENQEVINKDKTTNGIFAPWIMYVEDLLSIGGHDKRVFAPMELEDSDLFNRFRLKGYNFIQARDAFVYHMTCRGSRFKDGVKIVSEIPLGDGNIWKRAQDSNEYTELRRIKFKEWWRKWHMDVLHDENMMPIVYPRYDIGFVVSNNTLESIEILEPWCDTLYVENITIEVIKNIQSTSKFDIPKRIKSFTDSKNNDIVLTFDWKSFGQPQYDFLKQLPLVLKESGEIGIMEYDIFNFEIKSLKTYENNLINADDPWYLSKLLTP